MSRVPSRPSSAASRALRRLALAALAAASLAAAGSGCSPADDGAQSGGPLLATVGAAEIRADYYEDRLAKLEREELPRDESGLPMDMSTEAGKRAFLENLINKEVMVQEAEERFGDEDAVLQARNSLLSFEAEALLKSESSPLPEVDLSDEELAAFHAEMGRVRKCTYLVTNHLEEAEAARAAALAGGDWNAIVEEYHAGDPEAGGGNSLSVAYGRYSEEFGDAVFAPEVGGFTEPISSEFGYWVLHIEDETRNDPPPLAEARARIIDLVRSRVAMTEQKERTGAVRERYGFYLDEDALWKAYQGLPAREDLFYPDTQEPVLQEDLKPLDVAAADLDLRFYGYVDAAGEAHDFTLGDYKERFDRMSVFQRPKRPQMLGGMRSKIVSDVDRLLQKEEAQRLGYLSRPEVLAKVEPRMQEVMVNKLHADLFPDDYVVTDDMRDAFWADHKDEYALPETRDGRVVVCADADEAEAARRAVADGTPWRDVLVRYGTDKTNKSRGGKIEGLRTDARGVLRDAMFALAPGETSAPFAAEDGRMAIVVLDEIHAPRAVELDEVRDAVDERMKTRYENEIFVAALAGWKNKREIVVHEENLAGLRSWTELRAAATTAGETPEQG